MGLGQDIPAAIERRLKQLERQVSVLIAEKKERENTTSVTETVEIKVEETTPVKKTRKRRARKKLDKFGVPVV